MAAVVIGAIRIDLGMQTTAFEKGASRAQRQADALGKKLKGVGKGMMGVGTIMSAASAGIVAGLISATKAGLEYASGLGETAQQLGVTTDELQQFRYAASQVGIEQGVVDKGLAKLTLTIGKAAAGSKPAAAAFTALGISITDAEGRVKSVGQLMPEIAEALSKIEDPARRATAEFALFGKAGQQFDTLLAGGAAKLNELTNAAKELGLVLTPEQIQKADDAADKFAALQQVLAAKISGVVADNSDAILGFVEGLADAVDGLVGFFSTIGPGMTKFLLVTTAIAVAFGPVLVGLGALVTGFGALVPAIAAAGPVLAAVGAAIAPLLISIAPLIIGIGAVVAAWYYWDEIVAIVERVGASVSAWYNENVKPTMVAAMAAIRPFVEFFTGFFGAQITGTIDTVSALMRGDFSGAFQALKTMGIAMLTALGNAFMTLAPNAIAAVRSLYTGVKVWIQDKLGAIFDWVGKKVAQVTGFFSDMYVAVVGNSYVPDMVDGIGAHMARLQQNLVDPASKATNKTTEAFQKMADEISPLLDRLFPEAAEENQYKAEQDLIARAEKAGAKKGGLTPAQAEAARQRLKEERMGDPVAVSGDGQDALDKVEAELDEYIQTVDAKLVDKTKKQTASVAQSYAEMAQSIIGSLDGMVQDFKRGDILGGIMGMLDLIGQVANLVAGISGKSNVFQGFGQQPDYSTPGYGGARAFGGPVVPGKTYRVGERGSEYFTPTAKGVIEPGNDRGGNTYNISGNLLTPEFWDKISQMDDDAAQRGAMAGATLVTDNAQRRGRQQLGRGRR
jgi:hypothetical protein